MAETEKKYVRSGGKRRNGPTLWQIFFQEAEPVGRTRKPEMRVTGNPFEEDGASSDEGEEGSTGNGLIQSGKDREVVIFEKRGTSEAEQGEYLNKIII